MTAPRIVVAGATTAITRRTVLRKAFLAPWHAAVQQCWLYALAEAQRHTGVAVHHSVLVVNHHHTSVTPTHDNLPDFLQRFHTGLSRSLNVLLCAERYDAPHELFDDRQAHTLRLMDAEAQAAHLVYERLNPVAAGLVDRLAHMPQRSLDFTLWKTGFLEVERPPVYFDAHRPERLRLELTPPPRLYEAFDGDLDRLVYHMERLTEHGQRAIRAARTRAPLGAKGLRRLHPWSEPRTLRESGGRPVPTFRYGARGMAARRARIDGAREVHAFRQQHRDTRRAHREGDHQAPFPFGTYAARVYHGALVSPEPWVDAQVAAPGPLLEDIDRELEERASRGERASWSGPPTSLLDEVQCAFVEEAADIVAEAEIDLTEATEARSRSVRSETRSEPAETRSANEPTETADGREPTDEREPARVRHRFDARRVESARRLIVLRDRRRGRPPGSSGNHGSDPPG